MRLIEAIREAYIPEHVRNCEIIPNPWYWEEYSYDRVKISDPLDSDYKLLLDAPFDTAPNKILISAEFEADWIPSQSLRHLTDLRDIISYELDKHINPQLEKGSIFSRPEVPDRDYDRYYCEALTKFAGESESDTVTLCHVCADDLTRLFFNLGDSVFRMFHAAMVPDEEADCDICDARKEEEDYIEPTLWMEREKRCEAVIHCVTTHWKFEHKRFYIKAIADACAYAQPPN